MPEIRDAAFAKKHVRFTGLSSGLDRGPEVGKDYASKAAADAAGRVHIEAPPGPYEVAVSDSGTGGWKGLGQYVIGGWAVGSR